MDVPVLLNSILLAASGTPMSLIMRARLEVRRLHVRQAQEAQASRIRVGHPAFCWNHGRDLIPCTSLIGS